MTAKSKIATKKHQFSLQSLYFSRYLMIRYFTAAYVFTNLFWLIFAIAYQSWFAVGVAAIMLALLLATSIEQASKWQTRSTKLPVTKTTYWVQLGANVALIAVCYSPLNRDLFPFSTNASIVSFIVAVLLLGILGALAIEKRIANITHHKDKYLKVIQAFESNQQ